jgi:Xaa-Pro aminopeptidase
MTRLALLGATLDLPLLVTAPANVRYLTAFQSSSAALLVEPGGTTTLYTDFRYADAAKAVPDVTLVQTGRDLTGELARLLTGREIAIEGTNLTVARWDALVAGGVVARASGGSVERLRAVKEPAELEAIRRACAISDRVYAELAREQFSGRTERELARWIDRRFRDEGADGLSFDPIVASGPNGGRPHAVPGDRIIGQGELVTIDIGCVLDGYCSDCTRTFATGPLPDQLADLYDLCRQAQADGLAAVRAGAVGDEVDAVSRVAIAERELASAYGHGLGHGVGMEVHEAPTLRPESTDVLAPNNVVSVEPGLYLPGTGGVRIEDLVAVTEDGCEILTLFTKDLLEVA